ncbi:MAG: 4'-phosphopantetheinyl transferase family protein, partial [Acidimicrobiales bacterium]
MRPEPAPVTTAPEVVTLWWAFTDIPTSVLDVLTLTLSDAERDRGERFRRAIDRHRFLAGRGWLRRLLGTELGCHPAEVPL